jgi:hypothetical protein
LLASGRADCTLQVVQACRELTAIHLIDGQFAQRNGVVGMARNEPSQRSAGAFFVLQTLLERELASQEAGTVTLSGFELIDQFQAARVLPSLQHPLHLVEL